MEQSQEDEGNSGCPQSSQFRSHCSQAKRSSRHAPALVKRTDQQICWKWNSRVRILQNQSPDRSFIGKSRLLLRRQFFKHAELDPRGDLLSALVLFHEDLPHPEPEMIQ